MNEYSTQVSIIMQSLRLNKNLYKKTCTGCKSSMNKPTIIQVQISFFVCSCTNFVYLQTLHDDICSCALYILFLIKNFMHIFRYN